MLSLLLLLLLPGVLLGVQQAGTHTKNSDHPPMWLSGGALGCTSHWCAAALPVWQY